MESLNDLLTNLGDATNAFTLSDVLLTIIISFVLALLIGWVYKITHRGTAYSQSYIHTLVLMSMVVAVIMLIIGSNIARAFTLVGALSIIRFRNAIKETRDVGYIFLAMAVGMAAGTRFYTLGVIATLTICFLLWIMSKFDMFASEVREQLLKIRLPADMPYQTLFDEPFTQYLSRVDLVAMETVQAGMLLELVYSISFKKSDQIPAFLEALRVLNNNNKIVLITGRDTVDL